MRVLQEQSPGTLLLSLRLSSRLLRRLLWRLLRRLLWLRWWSYLPLQSISQIATRCGSLCFATRASRTPYLIHALILHPASELSRIQSRRSSLSPVLLQLFACMSKQREWEEECLPWLGVPHLGAVLGSASFFLRPVWDSFSFNRRLHLGMSSSKKASTSSALPEPCAWSPLRAPSSLPCADCLRVSVPLAALDLQQAQASSLFPAAPHC